MIDKNKGEKEKLQVLAGNPAINKTYTFPDIDNSVDSYYIHRSGDEEYIRKYEFSGADELRAELQHLWNDEPQMVPVIKVVMVAALKNIPDLNGGKNLEMNLGESKEENLPAYIYNF